MRKMLAYSVPEISGFSPRSTSAISRALEAVAASFGEVLSGVIIFFRRGYAGTARKIGPKFVYKPAYPFFTGMRELKSESVKE
jgi:hypothetical protein